jgi:hypothetical protein
MITSCKKAARKSAHSPSSNHLGDALDLVEVEGVPARNRAVEAGLQKRGPAEPENEIKW